MNLFEVFILSIIEGITEFLPVSSTGHLILTTTILKIPQTDFVKSFEIIIQLGAILAVFVLYLKLLWINKKLWLYLITGFLPSDVIGLLLYKFIKEYLIGNQMVTVITLICGGIILLFLEKLINFKQNKFDFTDIDFKKSFIIGIFQALSIIPGVSRSAASIIGGMFLGLTKKTASEFSFLLAIPTMIGATVLDLIETDFNYSRNETGLLLAGVFLSFISALFGIKFLIKFVQKHSFAPFGIYRIILGIVFYLLFLR